MLHTPTRLSRRVVLEAVLWVAVAVAVVSTFAYRLSHWQTAAMGYDDGVYWQTGWALADGDSAYDQVFHSQPPLFAWLLSASFQSGGIGAARLLMTGFTVMLVVVAAGIATTLRGASAGMLAALGVAAVPVVQQYAFQLGADLPGAACGGAALWCALGARTSRPSRRRWLWLATGGLVGLAALTKLIAIVVVPAVVVALVTVPPTAQDDGRPWWRRPAAAAGWSALGFGLVVATVLGALRPPREAWFQIFGFHVGASVPEASAGPIELMTLAGSWCPWLFIAAGVATLVGLFRPAGLDRRAAIAAVALWAVAIFPFTVLYDPTFVHHLSWFVAPCVILIAVALVDLSARATRSRSSATAVLVAVALIGFVSTSRASVPRPAVPAPAMKACLQALPDGATLVGDDQGLLASVGLRTPPWLVDTSIVRLDTGRLTDVQLIESVQSSAGALLSRQPRLRSRARLVAWLDANRPVRYDADGYTVYLKRPYSGCSRS